MSYHSDLDIQVKELAAEYLSERTGQDINTCIDIIEAAKEALDQAHRECVSPLTGVLSEY